MLDRYLRISVVLIISFVLPLAAADKSKNASANGDQPSYDQPQPRVETLDLNMYQRIRLEGLNHSHVMEYASALVRRHRAAPDRLAKPEACQ